MIKDLRKNSKFTTYMLKDLINPINIDKDPEGYVRVEKIHRMVELLAKDEYNNTVIIKDGKVIKASELNNFIEITYTTHDLSLDGQFVTVEQLNTMGPANKELVSNINVYTDLILDEKGFKKLIDDSDISSKETYRLLKEKGYLSHEPNSFLYGIRFGTDKDPNAVEYVGINVDELEGIIDMIEDNYKGEIPPGVINISWELSEHIVVDENGKMVNDGYLGLYYFNRYAVVYIDESKFTLPGFLVKLLCKVSDLVNRFRKK